jgi:hypothetical protein
VSGSVGSAGVAAWIAQIAFWVLIVLGLGYGELSKRAATIFIVLWVVDYLAIPRIA